LEAPRRRPMPDFLVVDFIVVDEESSFICWRLETAAAQLLLQ
jgi:hypothetical protein